MIRALSTKNKLQFLDGTIAKPAPGDPLFRAWSRNNTLLLGWILRSVSPSIALGFQWFEDALLVWNELRERFSRGNNFRIAELQEDLFRFKQGSQSVSAYFTQMTTWMHELDNFLPIPPCRCNGLCNCGLAIVRQNHQINYVLRFVRGLNDSFAAARSQIMLMNPMPSLNQAFAMIIEQEKQNRILAPPSLPDSMAMYSRGFPPGRNQSYPPPRSPYPTPNPSTNPQPPHPGSNRPFCTHCHSYGHTVDKCYKLHGFPPGYKGKAKAHCVSTEDGSSDDSTHPVHPAIPFQPQEWNQIQETYQKMTQFMQSQYFQQQSPYSDMAQASTSAQPHPNYSTPTSTSEFPVSRGLPSASQACSTLLLLLPHHQVQFLLSNPLVF
ncbi:unnamed protein product [Linum trigynum]|uniref:Retrotransposon gag domain-containing protein n=1 Tax=Linum trigynum TaxID=586398 RepID=A0AAV2EP72_9ROSI